MSPSTKRIATTALCRASDQRALSREIRVRHPYYLPPAGRNLGLPIALLSPCYRTNVKYSRVIPPGSSGSRHIVCWQDVDPPVTSGKRRENQVNARLDLVGIVARDMGASLSFYRWLGLDIPEGVEDEPHVEAATPSGLRVAWD